MKTLLMAIICFGLTLNFKAQNLERASFKIILKDNTKSTLRLDQKLVVMKGLLIDLSPQFGNQFISQIEAKKAKINLKDYYNNSDFGLNMGFNFVLKEQLSFKAIYNMGILKFNKPNIEKQDGYVVKLSIDYAFN